MSPRTVACQASLPMGFLRQESWNGLPSPSPGDLPDPGTERVSPVSPEKAVAAHLSTLAWTIPWREEPGGLLSVGSHRIGHD